MKTRFERRGRLVGLLILIATAAVGVGPGAALAAEGRASKKDPEAAAQRERLAQILARFDETQVSTRTLTASFSERKEIKLLKDPVLSRGRFFYTKPDDVLLQYTEPELRYLLFTKKEQLYYFPKQKRAERGTSARVHDYLFRFLAIGQTSDSLRKFYEIALDESNNDVKDTYLLLLKPRKRIVKKAVQEVRLWVSKERLLPVCMQWREPDGDSTTITFEEVRFNPDIQASVYKIDLPKDVEIIKRRVPGAGEFKEKGEG